jgi:hypothetical protein
MARRLKYLVASRALERAVVAMSFVHRMLLRVCGAVCVIHFKSKDCTCFESSV